MYFLKNLGKRLLFSSVPSTVKQRLLNSVGCDLDLTSPRILQSLATADIY